ncbi:MAG: cupin [Clostridiales bacterium]|nr:MAG: cupin [Clostridiales bacterium]
MITLRSDMMINHLEKEKILNLSTEVPYQENKIVSKTISNNEGLVMTLLSFDGEQEISTHSAPGDALVIALDGEADITIDGKLHYIKKGESIIMPANVPHAVNVKTRYQMLLIVSK